MIVFCFLLMLSVGRCRGDRVFGTKTVGVGDDVRLTCTRRFSGSLYWIRLVSGDLPKVLGKSFRFESNLRITATEGPGTFVLRIKKAELSDTAVYYCMKISQQDLTFLNGTDLRVEGPKPDIITAPPSDPVRPGDSVTLQCPVLSDSESKMCPEEHSVCCFKPGSHQYCPGCNDTQRHGVEVHEKNPETLSTRKCVYSFIKTASSSDAGTYCCAVATCEEIFNGNGSKLNTQAVNMLDLQKDNIILFLCAALAISLIVIAFLIYSIKKLKTESCGVCNTAVVQTNAATDRSHQQPTDEDSLVYSAPTFTSRKTSKGGSRDVKAEEEESIYSGVRALQLE